MHEKCPYSEFFRPEFSHIWTDYGEYTPRIQFECGKIRTRKNPNTDTFHVVIYIIQRKGYFLFAWIATNFTWICHSPIIFKCNVADTHGDLSNFRVALSCFFKYFYLVIFIFTDSTKGAVIVSCKRMKGLRTKQNFSIILPTTFRISIHQESIFAKQSKARILQYQNPLLNYKQPRPQALHRAWFTETLLY